MPPSPTPTPATPAGLEIAGVRFETRCPQPVVALHGDSAYQAFYTPGATTDATVSIELGLGNLPDRNRLTKVFDSGVAWSMFRDREQRYISLDAPGRNGPLWLAQFDPDCAHVNLRCSPDFATELDNGEPAVANPVRYPLDQLLLMHALARRAGVLIHAAGVEFAGHGLLFPGRSGAGKSTLTRCLHEAARADTILLSDDRIAVRRRDGVYLGYGTPWPGEAGVARNQGAPLSAMFFLAHGDNRIQALPPHDTLARLLPVASIPWYDDELSGPILHFCEALIRDIPAFELRFTPGTEVVDMLARFAARECHETYACN